MLDDLLDAFGGKKRHKSGGLRATLGRAIAGEDDRGRGYRDDRTRRRDDDWDDDDRRYRGYDKKRRMREAFDFD